MSAAFHRMRKVTCHCSQPLAPKYEKTRFVAKGQDSGAKMRSQQEHRAAN